MVYKDLGLFLDAAGLLEATLRSSLTHFGPNHPSVAICQSNLALVYEDLGRYNEAAGLLEAALQNNQANFGTDYPM